MNENKTKYYLRKTKLGLLSFGIIFTISTFSDGIFLEENISLANDAISKENFDKENINSLIIKSKPAKLKYNVGDNLTIADLSVTITDISGNMKDVNYNEFSKYGISTNLVDGVLLTKEMSNIVVSAAGKKVDVSLEIKEKDELITNNTKSASPIKIKVYEGGDEFVDKVFNSGEQLGLPKNWGRSNWHIKTYRKIFLGWSTSQDPLVDGSKIYRDADIIDTLVKDLGGIDKVATTVLNPIFVNQFELMAYIGDITDSANIAIASDMNYSDIVLNSDVKEHSGFNMESDLSTAAPRNLKIYYDQDLQRYEVKINSQFEWKKRIIPLLVVENPIHLIRGAEGVVDFSGVSPTNYTYEDLIVELDPNVETSELMSNLEFRSSLFKVAAVLDENYNVLESTISEPSSTEMLTKFSFKNPNKGKKFIIRTVIRNYGSQQNKNESIAKGATTWTADAENVLGRITLTSGDASNIIIPKNFAKIYADNPDMEFKFLGKVNGNIATDKSEIPFPFSLFLANNYKINEINSTNYLAINFANNKVTFNKNSSIFGDAANQDLKTVTVVHNQSINNDELSEQSMPNISNEMILGDKIYIFKGWNSKSDGSGENFTGESIVNEDTRVYAIWEEKVGNFTVTFKSNYGENIEYAKVKVEKGASIDNDNLLDQVMPKMPTREGYVFKGWSENPIAQIADFYGSTTVSKDTTVYAIWDRVLQSDPNKPEQAATSKDKEVKKLSSTGIREWNGLNLAFGLFLISLILLKNKRKN